MEKMGKALHGLAACSTEPETGEQCRELNCPYWNEDTYCVRELMLDALESLTTACGCASPDRGGTGARVLAYEELLAGHWHGWEESWHVGDEEDPEYKDLEECVCLEGFVLVASGSNADARGYYWAEHYNKRYGIRVWVADQPPTEEQREAAAWNE